MLAPIELDISMRRTAVDWLSIVSNDARTRVLGPEELQRLQRLRRNYQEGSHIFTACELGKLRFVRWLVQTGRLQVG
jgi:hypothetical protein